MPYGWPNEELEDCRKIIKRLLSRAVLRIIACDLMSGRIDIHTATAVLGKLAGVPLYYAQDIAEITFLQGQEGYDYEHEMVTSRGEVFALCLNDWGINDLE